MNCGAVRAFISESGGEEPARRRIQRGSKEFKGIQRVGSKGFRGIQSVGFF